MSVEDVFSITGRGTVATGAIETGIVNTGDSVDIVGLSEEKMTSTVTGVEMFRKILDEGRAGENVGLLLRGIEKDQIKRGMVIAKPGSITPHAKFKAEVYILKKEEGGRHTPFHNNYRPQFYFRTLDVTGTVQLEAGREMVMPGDNVTIDVELITGVAMAKGLRFAIREGRTVGAGQVTGDLRLIIFIFLCGKGALISGCLYAHNTGVAQLVEHWSPKPGGVEFESLHPCKD